VVWNNSTAFQSVLSKLFSSDCCSRSTTVAGGRCPPRSLYKFSNNKPDTTGSQNNPVVNNLTTNGSAKQGSKNDAYESVTTAALHGCRDKMQSNLASATIHLEANDDSSISSNNKSGSFPVWTWVLNRYLKITKRVAWNSAWLCCGLIVGRCLFVLYSITLCCVWMFVWLICVLICTDY